MILNGSGSKRSDLQTGRGDQAFIKWACYSIIIKDLIRAKTACVFYEKTQSSV